MCGNQGLARLTLIYHNFVESTLKRDPQHRPSEKINQLTRNKSKQDANELLSKGKKSRRHLPISKLRST